MVVQPVRGLRGTLTVPGDKSISHRAVMLGSLAYGKTTVRHFLDSADCLSTAGIFRNLGVKIRQKGDRVEIWGNGLNSLKPTSKVLDAGNSGTSARILLGLLSGQPFTTRLTGDRYLRRRPMRRVVEPLTRMGARFTGPDQSNLLPLKIEPRALKGIRYELPVASAQVKSALMMAALFAHGKTVIVEPTSTRDHTERMFSAFSIPFKKKGKVIVVPGPAAPFKGRNLVVPGDISSAAFFIVAALITPHANLQLKRVGVNPTRTGLLVALRKMGAFIGVKNIPVGSGEEPIADLTITTSSLKGITIGGDIVPRMVDEFPIFAVAATQARGTTVVKNAQELRVKESDRILMMEVTLRKMGADIKATPDGWIIKGPTPLKGAVCSSGGDHRIAMSLAVAALIAQGPTTITDTENIDTSFPGFESMLRKVSVQ